MLEWDDYIKMLLNQKCSFDNISLSLRGEPKSSVIPPIIKASVLLLDRMISTQGKYNLIVFPEKAQTAFIFMLVKLLHNINEGKIEKAYNPESFVKGEKLKFQNCIIAFNSIDVVNGVPYLWVDNADCKVGVPIEIMPLLQRTNTNRRLSTYKKFASARRKASQDNDRLESADKLLRGLADFKTHMDSSIFYVAPALNIKEQLSECKLNGKAVDEILFIGHTNYAGQIKNIGPGQLAGIPSIVLASDLYAVCAAVEKRSPIQSMIVDVSNNNANNSQIDALDELMRAEFPIVCITDVANSFGLQLLASRGFNIWRWDEKYITDNLYNSTPLSLEQKVRNCAKRRIEFINSDSKEISESLEKLYKHRTEINNQSAQMLNIFETMFSLTLSAVRNILPVSQAEAEQPQSWLYKCDLKLSEEKPYISEGAYWDHKNVIDNLKIIFSPGFVPPKYQVLQEHLKSKMYPAAYLIVPNKSDKNKLQEYWQNWCVDQDLKTKIKVLYPSEYFSMGSPKFTVTIVSGWLNNETMRKILFSFNTVNYVVLIYDYEEKWKNSHTAQWTRFINESNNKRIIMKASRADRLNISISSFSDESQHTIEDVPDELNEIELVLQENKYKQYTVGSGQCRVGETIEVIPVNFVGEFFAFFRTTHEIVTATDIIMSDEEKIKIKTAAEIKVGDFVVIREADRDLIRELADKILGNSGKLHLRDIATKWKESLATECWFSTHEEIFQRLKAEGCSVTYPTVRGWIMDEDKIAPENKDDLMYIALITEDTVLFDMVDEVFDAAREVRSAHIQAGRYLSSKLKEIIASALLEYGNIDPFNIWEPVILHLEDIGMVKILKVIDIGTMIEVDAVNANRLIEEI